MKQKLPSGHSYTRNNIIMLHCMHTNIQVAYNLALQWTVISINLCTAGNNIHL